MTSIGDFAESLINEELQGIKSGKTLPPSLQTSTIKNAPAGKDIRDIDVPDSFMQEILGEEYVPTKKAHIPEPEEVIEEEIEPSVAPTTISEEKAEQILSLLSDVKTLLSEMVGTGTGGLGAQLGSTSNVQPCTYKSGGYLKSKPAKKKTKKSAMKQAMSSKLRRVAARRKK